VLEKINDHRLLQLKHPANISLDNSIFPPSRVLAFDLLIKVVVNPFQRVRNLSTFSSATDKEGCKVKRS
jgi:hypothetical protein